MPGSREYLPPEIKKVHSRTRLFRFFEEKRVIFIEGAPGQGKTTAAIDYINSEDKECIWNTLDDWDLDYKVFLDYLESYIRAFTGNPADDKAPYLVKEERDILEDVEDFCERVIDLIPDDLFIVFDKYEVVNSNQEVSTAFEHLLDMLIEKARIIILTREAPELSLAHIRSRKELTELKNRDLAFSREEIRDLLYSVYDMSFDSIVLDRLLEVTDGWITGIIFLMEKLCTLNRKEGEALLENFLHDKGTPELDDFFESQVLARLDDDLIPQLYKLSCVHEFTPELVEALTGVSGLDFIEMLQNKNLFVWSDEPIKYMYGFNPLFQTYLKYEFDEMPEDDRRQTLIDAAAYYKEEEDDPYTPIMYLAEAGELERAKTELIELSEELIKNNEHEAIHEVLNYFPEEMREEDPYLAYYEAVVKNLMQPETSRKKLLKLLYVFRSMGEHNKEASIYAVLLTNYFFFQTNAETVGNIINMAEDFLITSGSQINQDQKELLEALIPLGQWWSGASREKAFEIALRAEEMSNKINNEEAFLCSRLVLSKIYISRGEFDQAMGLLENTEKMFSEGTLHLYKYYNSLLSFYMGDIFFYKGEIPAAINRIHKAISSSGKDFAFRPYLYLNLVFYNLYTHNTEKADSHYAHLKDSDTGENLYLLYNINFLFEMLLAYRNNNVHRTEYYCNRLMEKENEKLLNADFPFSHIALAEVSIFAGNGQKSRKILSKLLQKINSSNAPYSFATAKALLGYICSKEGDPSGADEHFREMEDVILKRKYTNLDVCSPELLKEISELSGHRAFENFPRLKDEKQFEELSNTQYDLEIETLGSFKVFVFGKEISADLLGGQKRVMDLLKLLVVYRKNGVMKERLYELFWPRYSYKSARDNLNTIIYRLRKLLNDKTDFLSTDVNSIRFKENTAITDVDRFLEYIEMGADAEKKNNFDHAIIMYKSAIETYKGDFLESDLYYDFIRDERENLKSRYRNLLFKMTILSINTAGFREALEWAKILIDADPLCEPAYRLLMIASAAVGNRSEIPRLFDKLNKKLQTYYKVTADEKTVNLKDRLLSGEKPDESMWKDETII